ncbi:similar to Saccharomyces cerevisiae YMR195W ICY1 Protein of unknown function, required for viability in rich media of cells lacking mitochondrial DNA [Maudiozyma saulgeensis]|uniref:Uncharacterized protein n=1 Tax=Maudiozyma saulgeensis TaxID=1789683 RepID=A0A1X7R7X6_9SACH|nr:similar to Saccharomyces cerevisiae YMR195W ICY1 Protein of unknown function, required for viability in rich media of cells lacking mitochondrial DNA [Kazachstania saulgeensis]
MTDLFNQEEFDQDEVFSLSFSNNGSFMNSIPLLSTSSNSSYLSTSPSDSFLDNNANNFTPALLSTSNQSNYFKENYSNNNNSTDIFQLEDNDLLNEKISFNNKKNLNYEMIDINQSINNNNNTCNIDAFANVAQQNYRIWASSV